MDFTIIDPGHTRSQQDQPAGSFHALAILFRLQLLLRHLGMILVIPGQTVGNVIRKRRSRGRHEFLHRCGRHPSKAEFWRRVMS